MEPRGKYGVALLVAASLAAMPALPADPLFAGGVHEPAHGGGVGVVTPPPGAERVTFESRNPRLKEPVPAVLIRPQGPGPFPSIVLVHPCGGIDQTMFSDWAPWFLARGYIVLVPDSLAPWHSTGVCSNWPTLEVSHPGGPHPTVPDAVLDAIGALRFLQSRPDVIRDRIALIGWSFGGSVAIVVTSTRFAKRIARGRYGGFQAGIGVYPGCGPFGERSAPAQGIETPLLLLVGGSDDWAVPDKCVQAALARKSAGDPVDLHVYPGVYHGFDVPTNTGTPVKVSGKVVHLMYSASATADAHTRVAQFLEEHLR